MSPQPVVSFVVPCYKYAHYLSQCVTSILEQSYGSWELLIMDDASPDDTPEVAASFQDPRVFHIRHPSNLGAVRNINAGIGRARGQYVWVISADDWLAERDAVARYVSLLDDHPRAGFVFSRARRMCDGVAARIIGENPLAGHTRIVPGIALYRKLVLGNFVVAPSVMVRRSCYDRIGVWNDGLRACPDWFTWCRLALHFDVAYVAEPQVCYRSHPESEMRTYLREVPSLVLEDHIKMFWLLREETERLGLSEAARETLGALKSSYISWVELRLNSGLPAESARDEFERSLRLDSPSEAVLVELRGLLYKYLGNQCTKGRDFERACQMYVLASHNQPWQLTTWALLRLLQAGTIGRGILTTLLTLRGWRGEHA